jgi:hypothetical protein
VEDAEVELELAGQPTCVLDDGELALGEDLTRTSCTASSKSSSADRQLVRLQSRFSEPYRMRR